MNSDGKFGSDFRFQPAGAGVEVTFRGATLSVHSGVRKAKALVEGHDIVVELAPSPKELRPVIVTVHPRGTSRGEVWSAKCDGTDLQLCATGLTAADVEEPQPKEHR